MFNEQKIGTNTYYTVFSNASIECTINDSANCCEVFCYENGKEIASIRAFNLRDTELLIESIFVREPYRKQGIGSHLIEQVINEWKEYETLHDIHFFRVTLVPSDMYGIPLEELEAFYAKRGFTEKDGPARIVRFL